MMAETVSGFFRLAVFNIGCLQVLDYTARHGVLSIIRDRIIRLADYRTRWHVVDS